MKRPARIIIAVIVIFFLSLLWFGLGSALFGWKNGGGAIPMMLFFGLVVFVWRAITKKRPEDDDDSKTTSSIDLKIKEPEK